MPDGYVGILTPLTGTLREPSQCHWACNHQAEAAGFGPKYERMRRAMRHAWVPNLILPFTGVSTLLPSISSFIKWKW